MFVIYFDAKNFEFTDKNDIQYALYKTSPMKLKCGLELHTCVDTVFI